MNARDLTAVRWRKSTRSGDTGGECVELAVSSHAVVVRDSKDPGTAVLSFTRLEFCALAHNIRAGRYDL